MIVEGCGNGFPYYKIKWNQFHHIIDKVNICLSSFLAMEEYKSATKS